MQWRIKCERAGEFVEHEIREFVTAAAVQAYCMEQQAFHGLAFSAEPLKNGAWAVKLFGLWNRAPLWRGFTYGFLCNIPLLLLERLM